MGRPSTLRSAVELAAGKPHGTRIRYVGGCRCLPCRAANSRYESERQAARKLGDWNGLVDAATARKYILHLSRLGVGRDAVSAASDVSATIISAIRSGRRAHIRRRTEQRILAVTVDASADGAYISGSIARKQIRELLSEGFTKAELARRLGFRSPALQFGQGRLRATSVMRLDKLYRTIMAGA